MDKVRCFDRVKQQARPAHFDYDEYDERGFEKKKEPPLAIRIQHALKVALYTLMTKYRQWTLCYLGQNT
jgi:hypothetical protein